MYRIELTPGEITVFRTIEELAIGVRNGVVTPRARIFHGASEKWLPIEFHPHYKRVLETPPGRPIVLPQPRQPERPRDERAGDGDAPVAHAPAVSPVIHAPTVNPAATVSPAAHAPAAGPVFLEPEPKPAESQDTEDAAGDTDDRELLSVTVSPVLQLPKITYAEITPAEEPVTDPAPRGDRSRRPLRLAGVALVLAFGGYMVVSAFSPMRTHAATATTPMVADRPAMPQSVTPRSTAPGAETPRAEHPPSRKPDSSARMPAGPAPVAQPARPAPPASSGFAAALEPRANVTAPALPPRPAPGNEPALASAPAPIRVDLAIPDLPAADSLAAESRQRDSLAIKRILRAVSGKDPAPQR